jgi:translocation and assembly module TamB
MAKPPQTPSAAPAPWSTGLGLLVPLGSVVALLLVILLVLGGAVRWLLFSEEGARWALDRLPWVQATGFQGALLGNRWQAEKLVVHIPGGTTESVTLEGLDAQDLHWVWRPHEHAWIGLHLRQLDVRRLTVDTGPEGTRPLPLPDSLAWPLHLQLVQARVQVLQIDQLEAIHDLQAQNLELDPRPGGRHSVQAASATWYALRVQAEGHIGTATPLPLALQATLRPLLGGDAPAWAAVLRASGDVPSLQVTGTLRGVPRLGRDAPAVDAEAQLQVLQRWPLAGLKLQTRDLDLSSLEVRAPATRLTGQAELASSGLHAPMSATLTMVNSLPGRWDEGRLPLQRLQAELRGRLDQPGQLELPQFDLLLADGSRSAGRITGSATWRDHALNLQAQLAGVTPQRVDGRAAAMQLSGPVTLALAGLPSPDPAATSKAPAQRAEWKLDLQGTLEAAPQPVRLEMQGSLDDQGLDLPRVRLTSGAATADWRARLQRTAREWKLQTSGALDDFDPLPWWPGEAGGAWRRGPHRLSADWELDAALPLRPERIPMLALAQRVAGNGRLRVHDAVLAGVPLTADISLGYAQAQAPTPASIRGEMILGGNRLRLEGVGDPVGAGLADRLQVQVQADRLAALAPLARLHTALETWLPRQGSARGQVVVNRRWPQMYTEGDVEIEALQAGALSLGAARANWRMDSSGAQSLALQAEATALTWSGRRVQALRADLSGTLADHHILAQATLQAAPSADWLRVLGANGAPGTQIRLQARGGWRAEAVGGGRWSAQVERLDVGGWDGKSGLTGAPATGAAWLAARDLKAQLDFDGQGGLTGLQADAGQLQLGPNVALVWDAVQMQFHQPRPALQLRARIDPFTVAPLLARLQPGMGWQGDLRVGARLDIQADERMRAEVVLERQDGDLHLGGTDGLQLLGLSEVRLALSVQDGLWLFTPRLKGRILGEIDGSVRMRTAPQNRWPAADAPLEGEVQAKVADIGIWSAWVPAGWRLAGELRTTAKISGTYGEPRYHGEVTGNGLAVRNLLAGVNVSGGQIDLRLEGDSARIERFTLRGGEGSLTVTGGASFEPRFQARLQAKAERFRVLARVDRSITASGNAELTLDPEQGRLEGRLHVDEGFFDASQKDAPSLDDDVSIRQADVAEQAVAEKPPSANPWRLGLNVDIGLGDQLRFRGWGVDTGLRGDLRLTGFWGQPALHGRIYSADGSYAAYGQKLAIDRGIVEFLGPVGDPRLDVLALRPNIDIQAGVLITGNVLSPRVRLYSNPELSDSEKLSWLVLGRAPDGLGRSDTALLQRAAVALLAGEGEAPTDALLKRLGIDEFSLRQGEGDVRETVISLGKQLSRRWYVGYERGVNATTGTWQLIYRIAQRFTLRAQSGVDNSLDVIWVWRTQEPPPDAAMRKSTLIPP